MNCSRVLFRTTAALLLLSAVGVGQNAETLFLADPFDSRPTNDRLNARLAQLNREVTAQQSLGNTAAVNTLNTAIATIQGITTPGTAIPPASATEVHFVGFYEGNGGTGGPATINVTRVGTPIILVLSAYENTQWTVTAAPGVTIQSIILSSYDPQTIVSTPPGVPVTTFDVNTGSNLFGSTPDDLVGRLEILAATIQLAGALPTTTLGSYSAPASPVEVGGANQDWRDQMALAEAVRATNLLVTATRATLAAQIAPFAFVPLLPRPIFSFGPPEAALADPLALIATVATLPNGVEDYALSPSGTIYVLNGSTVSVLSPGSFNLTPLPPVPAGLPSISNPSGITFDLANNRLLLSTVGGAGVLYGFDEGTQTWSVVNSFNNRDPKAIVYHTADLNVYTVERGTFGFGPLELAQYDAAGNFIQSTQLPLDTWDEFFESFQAYSVGPYIAVVGPPRETLGLLLRHCFLVDPTNGDIVSSSVYFN